MFFLKIERCLIMWNNVLSVWAAYILSSRLSFPLRDSLCLWHHFTLSNWYTFDIVKSWSFEKCILKSRLIKSPSLPYFKQIQCNKIYMKASSYFLFRLGKNKLKQKYQVLIPAKYLIWVISLGQKESCTVFDTQKIDHWFQEIE